MKKIFILEDLDCAHCASKIEEGISKIEGVKACSVAFLTKKMTIDMEEGREIAITKEAKKLIRKLEPDVEVVEK